MARGGPAPTPGPSSAEVGQPDAGPSRYRWVIFGLTQAGVAVNIVLGVSLGLMLPAIMADLAMTPVEQGLLGSSIRIGGALLGIPAAWWLSRYRPFRVMLAGLVIGTVALLVQATAPAYGSLLAGRALFGVATLAIFPARTLLYRQWFPLHEIALVNGVSMFVIGVVEWAAAAFTPQTIDLLGGWRAMFLAIGAYAATVTVLWTLLGRERSSMQAAPLEQQERPAILSVFRYRQVWLIFLGVLGGPASWWAFNTFWPQYMLETYGLPLTTTGFVFGLTSLGMAPGSLLFGWLASRHGAQRGIIIWCSITMLLGSLVMVATDNVVVLVLAASAVGLSWGFTPIVSTVPYHLPGVQAREVAVVASVIGTAFSLGGVLGPFIAGALAELTGSTFTTLIVLSFIPLSLSAIVLGLPKQAAQPLS